MRGVGEGLVGCTGCCGACFDVMHTHPSRFVLLRTHPQAKASFRQLDTAVGRLAMKLPVGELEPQGRAVGWGGGGVGGVGVGWGIVMYKICYVWDRGGAVPTALRLMCRASESWGHQPQNRPNH